MTSQRLDDDKTIVSFKRRKLNDHGESDQGSSSAIPLNHLSHDDYTVGWICALPIEYAAAIATLDQVHPTLLNAVGDDNAYTLGQIGVHNIAVACMPSGVYGSVAAVTVATMMRSSFRSLRAGFMIGIGGGVPSPSSDIRLGDVVVSKPGENFGGVIQYDFGKTIQGGTLKRIGTLNKPPHVLLTAMSQLRAIHMIGPSRIPNLLSEMVVKYPAMRAQFSHPGQECDQLFEAQYEHVDSEVTCKRCSPSCLVVRPPRIENDPKIHYGLIASSNQVMRHGGSRDRLARELGIICFEMEAAGLMDQFPCVVIRGICDYSDSYKNKQWQGYAAATAAAYAKELVSEIPGTRVSRASTAFTVSSSQLPGVENVSLTGDNRLQAAILRYNTELLVKHFQRAHSELSFNDHHVSPHPADDRALSIYTPKTGTVVGTLIAQLASSVSRLQSHSAPSAERPANDLNTSVRPLGTYSARPKYREDFRIAIICALPLEAEAIQAVFDKRWDDEGLIYGKAPQDQNAYSTGAIGCHNVVLVHMPGIGKQSAARAGASLRSSFSGVRLALVVGICGAVPVTKEGEEIFLGDIIMSEGIISYDFGKLFPDRFARNGTILESLRRPSAEIRALLAKLTTRRDRKNLESNVCRHLSVLQQELGEISRYPGASRDRLFLSNHRHKHQRRADCVVCSICSQGKNPVCDLALSVTCEDLRCDVDESVVRSRIDRSGGRGATDELAVCEPKVHFGLVASGDSVIKSGEHRDQIAGEMNVVAFEMEGAGVWDIFPCMLIKGVCDYADSHKEKGWQSYAAAAAAACAKAFLENWVPSSMEV